MPTVAQEISTLQAQINVVQDDLDHWQDAENFDSDNADLAEDAADLLSSLPETAGLAEWAEDVRAACALLTLTDQAHEAIDQAKLNDLEKALNKLIAHSH